MYYIFLSNRNSITPFEDLRYLTQTIHVQTVNIFHSREAFDFYLFNSRILQTE